MPNHSPIRSASAMNPQSPPLVGIIMGSKSDWETLQHADQILSQFEIAHECKVVSAHRTPQLMVQYATDAQGRGLQIIIAGAGGAAHLPGIGSGQHAAAGDRRSRAVRRFERNGFAAVDRADARRGAGGDDGDRQSRARSTLLCWRSRFWPIMMKDCAKNSGTFESSRGVRQRMRYCRSPCFESVVQV